MIRFYNQIDIKIYPILLLLIFVFSCKGQKKTDDTNDTTSQSKPAETNAPQVDTYFTPSQTIATSYGPNSITRNIIQDKKGDLWFATWEGLMHYDGEIFTNFTNKEGLKPFRVFSILEDKNGDIWCGTIGAGVYHYDGKTFTNFTTKEGLVNNRVTCISQTKNGNIWFCTEGGVSKYNGKSFTNFTTKEGLTNNDVNAIVEDKNGKFWLGTRGDACTYDGKTFTKLTNKEGRTFGNVRSIIEDKKGNIWLGGNDGLWSYDGNSFSHITSDFVGYIYQDKDENIWTSSAASNINKWLLSKYDKKSVENKTAKAVEIKADHSMFFGITEDKEGNIWLGTLNGVYRYDGNSFNDFKGK
mgnify:CR=1 FL=1